MEQRRTRRFTLELPLAITRNGPDRVAHTAVTRNISSGGVLFTTDREFDVGGSIEYAITLDGTAQRCVTLRCIGKIVRFHRLSEDDHQGFNVAATLERYEFVRAEKAQVL